LDGPIGNYEIPVANHEHGLFEGLRTVFTLSKNNDLTWIKDWLDFYVRIHKANAVLFYDNGSTDYTARELLATLSSVSGIETAVLVNWPFKHGPTGVDLNKNWDSNFSQLGMMEHARNRFLRRARSVLNCDIDELVMSKDQRSIFQEAEESFFGVIAFPGDWVVGIQGATREGSPSEPVRFKDFQFVLNEFGRGRLHWGPARRTRCQPKWALIPGRMPAKARWHIHYIEGWPASRLRSRTFCFRHFREISTSWKYNRRKRDEFDSAAHTRDELMETLFSQLGWIEPSMSHDEIPEYIGVHLSSLSS
jgi:hypothetical protein